MKRSWSTFLGAALVLALAMPTGASTFLALSQEEMVAQADSVVQGRVVEVNSFWNRQGTAIVTEAVLEVEETVLGRERSHVRLFTFGGEVGDYRIEAHGFPTFRKDQRLLVFLEPARKDEEGAHRVLGYRQGEFEIRAGEAGRDVAVPTWEAAEQARVLEKDGTEAEAPKPRALDDFKREIRETAGRMGRPDAGPRVR
jgi:hypothetical protein